MDDQLRLDRQLTDFFAEAKATSLTPDEREHCRFAIESHVMAHSVSLTAEGRHDGMAHGRESSRVFLNEKEKRQLRKNLVSFMQQNPRYIPDAEVEAFSLYRIFELAFPRFALGVLMFVGVGAGVTFASQASVPGDFLYPFKVNVYEPVVSKLATSDTSQAAWEARRAQNRLKEATKLAADSKLTVEAAADLRVQFQQHLEKAQRNIDTLEAKGNAEVATSIQTSLNTYLESNSSIVRRIVTSGGADSSVGAAAAITAKEPPSSNDNANGRAKKQSSSRGYSLVETVQTILSNSAESSSSSSAAAKSSAMSKSEDNQKSSASTQAQSSAAASVQVEVDVDVEIDIEANLGTQVSSAATLVPALFNDIMDATSSANPPLPNLLP